MMQANLVGVRRRMRTGGCRRVPREHAGHRPYRDRLRVHVGFSGSRGPRPRSIVGIANFL